MNVYLNFKKKWLNLPVRWQRYTYIYIYGKKVFVMTRTLGQWEMRVVSWILSSQFTKVIIFFLFFSLRRFLQLIITGFLSVGNNATTISVFFLVFYSLYEKEKSERKATHTYIYVLPMKHVTLSYAGRQLRGRECSLVF